MLSTKVVQKPELKLLGISVDEQLRVTTQHLQERCDSCRHDIEITEINTYISKLQIVKAAVLPHVTANWCQMPESQKNFEKEHYVLSVATKELYYVWLICLLYRIVGFYKRPRVCIKQQMTYHLPA